MSDLDDIFEYELSTIVFIWGSITMIVVSAMTALWLVKSKHGAATAPIGKWFRVNSPPTAPAPRP
jgi:hypothetical protein